MRTIKKIKAGDRREYPFNHAFTAQEKKVFGLIAQLKATMGELKTELAKTPKNACSPPENFDPRKMEEIGENDRNLDTIDLHLRWIPGGAYRFD